MNISVRYSERCGEAEAEVRLTTDLPEEWRGLSRHITDLQDAAKEAVRRQLCDCGCTPREDKHSLRYHYKEGKEWAEVP